MIDDSLKQMCILPLTSCISTSTGHWNVGLPTIFHVMFHAFWGHPRMCKNHSHVLPISIRAQNACDTVHASPPSLFCSTVCLLMPWTHSFVGGGSCSLTWRLSSVSTGKLDWPLQWPSGWYTAIGRLRTITWPQMQPALWVDPFVWSLFIQLIHCYTGNLSCWNEYNLFFNMQLQLKALLNWIKAQNKLLSVFRSTVDGKHTRGQ